MAKKIVPTIIDAIRAGDRVTILTGPDKDQPRTGTARIPGPHGWVLDMGGPHGTPGIATDENITKVSPSKRGGSSR